MADGSTIDKNPVGKRVKDTKDPTQDNTLAKLKRYFTEFRDLTATARTESLKDQDYYDSKQWTDDELKALARRQQPDIVINRIKPAINGIVGVVERGRSDPRAWPRQPGDEDSADVATDVLRYIADYNRWPKVKADCFLDMLVPGAMALLVGADQDREITFEQIRWEELIFDPRSRRRDFKDARYLGIAKWMYADDVSALYPDKADAISATVETGVPGLGPDLSFQDRPSASATQVWVDRKQRRLMVVELYYREAGTWLRSVFTGADILETGDSPYVDHKGKPHCPIEAQCAYVDRENQRYGAVRDMRGPQDEINKRRSKALHLLNVRQVQAKDSMAIDSDADVARLQASLPDGALPVGWEVVPLSQSLAGHLELLQEAKGEIERMGPNPAVLGRDGNDSSGRALLARQQAGLVELANLFAQLDDWELRILRQAWARAKQFWKAPQWIRVTDDDQAPKFVGINMPKGAPVVDPATGQPVVHPETDEAGQPHPQAGQPVEGQPQYFPQTDPTGEPHPQAGQSAFGYKNAIGEMDVDITVDTVQDTGTLQQEQFNDLMQIIGANPGWAAQVPVEVPIRLSAMPKKRQVLDLIKATAQQVEQADAAQKQIEAAEAKSKIEKNEADATLARAKAGAATAGAITDHQTAHVDAAQAGLNDGLDHEQTPPPGGPLGQTGAPGDSSES